MDQFLSKAEEAELHARMIAGDNAARDALVTSVWKWACRCVRRSPLSLGYSQAEVDSTAGLAIALALQSFNPTQGRLSTLVYYAARTTLIDEARNRTVIHVPEKYYSPNARKPFAEDADRARAMRSLHAPRRRRAASLFVDRCAANPYEEASDAERLKLLQEATEHGLAVVGRRSPRATQVLRMHFSGMRVCDIASELNISRDYVHQLLPRWTPVFQAAAREYLPSSMRQAA